MVSVTILDLALAAAVLVAAAISLLPRSRSLQAMGFLSLGVVMSLVWLRLGSVDVALAEAGLGAGLLSAILVWLAVQSPEPNGAIQTAKKTSLPTTARTVLGLVSGAVIAAVAVTVWLRIADELPRWDATISDQTQQTGVTHEVTAVLLAFRAYDTLLETVVLMIAGVAVLALGRGDGLATVDDPLPAVPPPLRWLTRTTAPILLLIGFWVLFAGSSDSGGAFQAGAVFAGLLILLHTTGVNLAAGTRLLARPALVIGVIVFLLVGAIGPMMGQPWLSWAPAWSFAAMLVIEVALTIGITAGLYLLYLTLRNPSTEVLRG